MSRVDDTHMCIIILMCQIALVNNFSSCNCEMSRVLVEDLSASKSVDETIQKELLPFWQYCSPLSSRSVLESYTYDVSVIIWI